MRPDDPRSPVWGGLTIAVIAGVVFGGISAVFGWGSFFGNGLKAAAALFTFMTVISLPGAVLNIVRRTPLASRVIGESVAEIVISAALVYLAFFTSA